MGENLELYFDEGGDFSIGNDPTDLLIISAVAAEMSDVLLYKLSIYLDYIKILQRIVVTAILRSSTTVDNDR